MQPIEAVIFDADGTLVDSETPGLDVLHEQALALGLSWELLPHIPRRFPGDQQPFCLQTACQTG